MLTLTTLARKVLNSLWPRPLISHHTDLSVRPRRHLFVLIHISFYFQPQEGVNVGDVTQLICRTRNAI